MGAALFVSEAPHIHEEVATPFHQTDFLRKENESSTQPCSLRKLTENRVETKKDPVLGIVPQLRIPVSVNTIWT